MLCLSRLILPFSCLIPTPNPTHFVLNYPKISIVTPSYNQADFLEITIQSVLGQAYPNLEYIIIDGGSSDNSVEIIKKYEKQLAYWVSEKDEGLYHALQKGFAHTTGDIMGWINSDDLLHPQSLFILADIFRSLPEVVWLQGYPCVFNEKGGVIYTRPPRSSKYNFYLKDYHDGQYIQQESTYWRRSLWDQAGGAISREYRVAGDFELWMRFFRYAYLYCTNALIGGFRYREAGQLSVNNYQLYLQEADQIVEREIKIVSNQHTLKRIKFYRKYLHGRLKGRLVRKYSVAKFNQPEIVFDFTTRTFTKAKFSPL